MLWMLSQRLSEVVQLICPYFLYIQTILLDISEMERSVIHKSLLTMRGRLLHCLNQMRLGFSRLYPYLS
ncbi:unnamed protein product [Lathyrus oleraceus]